MVLTCAMRRDSKQLAIAVSRMRCGVKRCTADPVFAKSKRLL
jgi:hypothetical protein